MAELTVQEYGTASVEDIAPHPRNPRQGDVGAIAESIGANGFYGAVLVQKSTGLILAGKHRWDSARAMRLAEIPVIWLDVDDKTALRIVLADNRTADLASYDDGVLASLLADLAVAGEGLAGTAWSADDLDVLLHDLEMHGSSGSATERETPSQRAPEWEASAIRSLVIPLAAADYEQVLADLAELRELMGAESNAAVILALVREKLG